MIWYIYTGKLEAGTMENESNHKHKGDDKCHATQAYLAQEIQLESLDDVPTGQSAEQPGWDRY